MNCSSEYKKQKKVKLVTLQKLRLIRGYIHQRQIKQISPRYTCVLPQCFITQSFQTLLSQKIKHNFVKENNVPNIQRRLEHQQAPCACQLCKPRLKDYLQKKSSKLKKLQLLIKIVNTQKSKKSLLATTKNIHYVATCNQLTQRGKKIGMLEKRVQGFMLTSSSNHKFEKNKGWIFW